MRKKKEVNEEIKKEIELNQEKLEFLFFEIEILYYQNK